MNIKDAYKHPKFYQKVDKTTGFRTRYEKERTRREGYTHQVSLREELVIDQLLYIYNINMHAP